MRIVMCILLILAPLVSKAQEYPNAFIKYYNECIKVYLKPIGHEIKTQIYQDSINETNYYKVELLDKSPLRFKVHMQAYDSSPVIIGWLDKECIAVYPRFINNREIMLYDEPDNNPKSLNLKDESDPILTVLDYKGIWLKVMFMIKGNIYIGWIDKYCPIIYNSCS